MKKGTLTRSLTCAAAALVLCARAALAADTLAVVSSEAGPYAEAYAAFSAGLEGGAGLADVSKPDFSVPEDVRYIVTFGAKATALEYQTGIHGVYALTPVVSRGPGWHQVSMAPAPAEALATYRDLQPGLRRLAVFWSGYPGEKYIAALRAAGEKTGVDIISVRLKSPDSLPERLRHLMGKMDAFWLMPDPALITQSSVRVLTDFSCANAVPFYAPTYALALAGAAASYAPDFWEAGAEAARAVAILRGGGKLPEVIYPAAQLKRNEELFERCRWPLLRP